MKTVIFCCAIILILSPSASATIAEPTLDPEDISWVTDAGQVTFTLRFYNHEPEPSEPLTGVLSANNFANPVSFICGAIQAASRLGAQQSAKLCAQYLAPIFKNRQYNFPPLGENLFVGQSARPNEITYSEDWMRPDYVPPAGNTPPPAQPPATGPPPAAPPGAPLPAEAPPPATPATATVATDPAAGLPGMMVPPGGGS